MYYNLWLLLFMVVYGKLHKGLRQSFFLPLLANEAKVAKHGHIFNFDDTKYPGCQFFENRPYRYNAHTISMF